MSSWIPCDGFVDGIHCGDESADKSIGLAGVEFVLPLGYVDVCWRIFLDVQVHHKFAILLI